MQRKANSVNARKKKKIKITWIEDEHMFSDDDNQRHRRAKAKSPGGKINGIHVHEYDAGTISKRTRKARRVQQQYNEQIQKEYEHLEKDTFIKDGKSVEVVCLD